MLHKSLGDDLSHDLIGVVDALAAPVSKRIGKRRAKSDESAGVSLSASGIAGR
jgi:hypothetical protein